MKTFKSAFLLAPIMLLCVTAFGQNFKIQVAAYVNQVSQDYFTQQGIEDVYMQVDQNDIYRYFIGGMETRADAEAMQAELAGKGFPNAQVIDVEEQRALCGAPCPYIGGATSEYEGSTTFVDELMGDLYVRAIFFDFDRSGLRAKSKSELDILYQILVQNPDYSTNLAGHTDSKGSDEYNQRLSMRRAKAAKDYLVGKGISASRIALKTFGEKDPIAKNDLSGADSPEGRQYNRRVVMALINSRGEVMGNYVEPINIPDYLRK